MQNVRRLMLAGLLSLGFTTGASAELPRYIPGETLESSPLESPIPLWQEAVFDWQVRQDSVSAVCAELVGTIRAVFDEGPVSATERCYTWIAAQNSDRPGFGSVSELQAGVPYWMPAESLVRGLKGAFKTHLSWYRAATDGDLATIPADLLTHLAQLDELVLELQTNASSNEAQLLQAMAELLQTEPVTDRIRVIVTEELDAQYAPQLQDLMATVAVHDEVLKDHEERIKALEAPPALPARPEPETPPPVQLKPSPLLLPKPAEPPAATGGAEVKPAVPLAPTTLQQWWNWLKAEWVWSVFATALVLAGLGVWLLWRSQLRFLETTDLSSVNNGTATTWVLADRKRRYEVEFAKRSDGSGMYDWNVPLTKAGGRDQSLRIDLSTPQKARAHTKRLLRKAHRQGRLRTLAEPQT